MKSLAVISLTTLISHFIFITLAFIGLQGLRLDRYFTPERQGKFKLVLIMVAVAIGFSCSSFFLSFVDNVRNLGYFL